MPRVAVRFGDLTNLKRQPGLGGLPQPMRAGMRQAMPYVSDAQRRFFHTATAKKAGITSAEVKEYDTASKGMKLPEKVGKRRLKVSYPSPKRPKK